MVPARKGLVLNASAANAAASSRKITEIVRPVPSSRLARSAKKPPATPPEAKAVMSTPKPTPPRRRISWA